MSKRLYATRAEKDRAWRERNPEKSAAIHRDYVERNRAALRERARAYRAANPEKCVVAKAASRKAHPETGRAYDRKRHHENREQERAYERTRNLRKYGLTPDTYAALLAAQDRRCAVCERPFEVGRKVYIDHDHVSGAVRGLLCIGCNVMLGHAKDSPEMLRAAASYLEREN